MTQPSLSLRSRALIAASVIAGASLAPHFLAPAGSPSLGLAAVFAPNSNAIGAWIEALGRRAGPIRAAIAGAALVLVVVLVVVNEARESVSAFIYFNF